MLHREDIVRRRGHYWRLRDPQAAGRFDADLLQVIQEADFRVCGIVIDKQALQARHEDPAHPYHLAMRLVLHRYCGELSHVERQGDVMAESRGGIEDRLLKAAYQAVYDQGTARLTRATVQGTLTSRELKLKQKSANIAGLQLADILAHPVREAILVSRGLQATPMSPFAARIASALRGKFHRHRESRRIDGHGKVVYPRSPLSVAKKK